MFRSDDTFETWPFHSTLLADIVLELVLTVATEVMDVIVFMVVLVVSVLW